MRFIEWPPLTRLCALLHNLDVGDRVIRGRLELLSTAARGQQEENLLEKIETELHSSPLFAASSPPPLLLSPAAAAAAAGSTRSRQRLNDPRHPTARGRELLVNLISTLNQCFPDYEFSSTLTPAMFREEQSLGAVQADINQRLGSVERVLPGFICQLWDVVESAVSLGNCSVYSHITSGSEDPTPLISLFSSFGDPAPSVSLSTFFYFFLDKQKSRLLFFACASNCKLTSPSWLGEAAGQGGEAEDDSDEVDIGEVYGAEATMQAELEPAEEPDSLSDLELPSSACAYA